MKLTRRQLLESWWVLPVAGTLGTLGYMADYAYRLTFDKRNPGPPHYLPGPDLALVPAAALGSEYAFYEFSYRQGRVVTPCILMRIPIATPTSLNLKGEHFAGFSRVCTHLGCHVNPVLNTKVLDLSFNYPATHPMLGCPCHFSVFDPLQQGKCVIGKALYPLPRVRLAAQDGLLRATGLEPPPPGHP